MKTEPEVIASLSASPFLSGVISLVLDQYNTASPRQRPFFYSWLCEEIDRTVLAYEKIQREIGTGCGALTTKEKNLLKLLKTLY
jgi:hypothetical protein